MDLFKNEDFASFIDSIMPSGDSAREELCPELMEIMLKFAAVSTDLVVSLVKHGVLEKFDSSEEVYAAVHRIGPKAIAVAFDLSDNLSENFMIDMLAALSAQRIFEESMDN